MEFPEAIAGVPILHHTRNLYAKRMHRNLLRVNDIEVCRDIEATLRCFHVSHSMYVFQLL